MSNIERQKLIVKALKEREAALGERYGKDFAEFSTICEKINTETRKLNKMIARRNFENGCVLNSNGVVTL